LLQNSVLTLLIIAKTKMVTSIICISSNCILLPC